MKTKVLKCKSDGNSVVAPYMELEPYAENVYLSLSEKSKDGNERNDFLYIVCRIGDVYFVCGQYSRRFFEDEELKEEAAVACRNWVENTLQDAKNGKRVSLLSIHVFEALGLDTTPLLQTQESYKKRIEQRRREEKEQEAEKRRRKEQEYQQWLNEQKQDFMDGEKITAEAFLGITGRDGFEIHIRTKGTFNRHVWSLNKKGAICYGRRKGQRRPDLSGCRKAISDYLKFLETGIRT